MERQLTLRRAFEHNLADYQLGEAPPRGPTEYHYYEELAGLSIRSTYDNGEDGACLALTAAPTVNTATQMRGLGMLLRPLPNGFSLLHDKRSQAGLFEYLERNSIVIDGRREYWTRLSFTLTVHDPLFVSATRFPIDANPLADNFYLTNQKARRKCLGGSVRLNPPGAFAPQKRLPVVPVQFPVTMPTCGNIRIYDIAGVVVYDGRKDELRKGHEPPCDQAAGHETQSTPKPLPLFETVYINMRLYPEDKYYLEVLHQNGTVDDELTLGWYIYTKAAPIPLFFVDLLFSDPTGEGHGVYPVTGLASGKPEIRNIPYVLQFHARLSTFFYCVVLRRGAYSDFRVVSVESPWIHWSDAVKVPLPNGELAWEIGSDLPLPLRQQPRSHFRLLGLAGDTWVTAIDRLPVPTPAAVTPIRLEKRADPAPEHQPVGGPTKAHVYVYV